MPVDCIHSTTSITLKFLFFSFPYRLRKFRALNFSGIVRSLTSSFELQHISINVFHFLYFIFISFYFGVFKLLMFHYLPEFSVCLQQTNLIKVDTNRLWFLIDLENRKVQSLGAKGVLILIHIADLHIYSHKVVPNKPL